MAIKQLPLFNNNIILTRVHCHITIEFGSFGSGVLISLSQFKGLYKEVVKFLVIRFPRATAIPPVSSIILISIEPVISCVMLFEINLYAPIQREKNDERGFLIYVLL